MYFTKSGQEQKLPYSEIHGLSGGVVIGANRHRNVNALRHEVVVFI